MAMGKKALVSVRVVKKEVTTMRVTRSLEMGAWVKPLVNIVAS